MTTGETRPDGGDRSIDGRARMRAMAVVALTLVLGIVAWLLYAGWVDELAPVDAPMDIPWWVVALLSAVADVFIIHINLRRHAYSSSLSEVPLVLGLVFASPAGLVVGRVVGTSAALALHRRQSVMKLAFNVAQEALIACVAVILWHHILGEFSPAEPVGWLAVFGTVLAVDALSPVLVMTAVSLYEGRPHFGALPRLLVLDLVAALTNTCLAVLAVVVLWQDRRAAWLLVVVAAIVHLAYRGYALLSQRYARLEVLYGFTRAIGNSVDPDSVMHTMLSEARELLRAETAELMLFGEPMMRAWLEGDDGIRTTVVTSPQTDAWWMAAATGDAVCHGRTTRAPEARAQLDAMGLKDAMAAPLRWGAEVVGVLIVGNRLSDVSTFTDEDLKVFETLANHASVSLENGRLVERLRREAAEKEHQALHDSLTGLPNRRLFQRHVEGALEYSEITGRPLAVILLDLDRFKEVNDTLGHHMGDLLLKEVGLRLRRTLHGRGQIARLGGDEFAILLPAVVDEAEALAQGTSLLRALEQPFTLREITLEVEASVGLAMAPAHGDEATLLLQRADIAMYAAKSRHAGITAYEPADDRYTRRRLALVGELRQALAERQLIVHYQPKVDAATGKVTGAEALVRWIHPEHGFLPPDEFIPLAEQTGLVRPLARFVLEDALHQCAAWRAAGNFLGVAVNLSVRNLVDPSLPDEVARLLAASGVPPAALTLEITESTIMVDPTRSLTVLERLHALGVTLSIDDFGTGYSSLGYLKRLPVDEVKIDRSFVMGMVGDENDAAIVQSTIVLAHNLGLHVVAEGVESTEVRDRLRRLGCDSLQGYFFSRPVPAAAFEEWLNDRVHRPAVMPVG